MRSWLRHHWEIWVSIGAALVVTALYLVAVWFDQALPNASSLVGHGIGVIGFVLMLMAETLYSIRKQRMDAAWGSMADWLRFHIVTGLVGPYMVLLHSAMRFSGLAGITMLLTVVTVASGIIGRYIYTSAPHAVTAAAAKPAFAGAGQSGGEVVEFSRVRAGARDDPSASPSASGGAGGRGALSSWHAFHVPLTWVLFTAAFVHVVAALYYATLQR